MADLLNLVVDLDERVALSPEDVQRLRRSAPGVEIGTPCAPSDATLAWIDEAFGGCWSSEAHAATTIVAVRAEAPIGFAAFDPKGLRFRWLRGIARERDIGVFGPFGVAENDRGAGLGRVLLRLALSELRRRGYARALIAAVGERIAPYYADAVGARIAERFDRAALCAPPPRTLLLASGSGSNVQAVLERVAGGRLPIDVAGVLSNYAQAPVVERARAANVEKVVVVPWRRKEEARSEYDRRLREAAAALRPDLVLLLGWMHLLDEPFVEAFPHLINLHPAFLPLDPQRDEVAMPDGAVIPAYRGKFAVRDALESGAGWIGATVHGVTPHTDRGPVFVRKPMRLEAGEDEAQIMSRLHPIEHELVAAGVMRWLYERNES